MTETERLVTKALGMNATVAGRHDFPLRVAEVVRQLRSKAVEVKRLAGQTCSRASCIERPAEGGEFEVACEPGAEPTIGLAPPVTNDPVFYVLPPAPLRPSRGWRDRLRGRKDA